MTILRILFASIAALCVQGGLIAAIGDPNATHTHTAAVCGDNSGIFQQAEGNFLYNFKTLQEFGVDFRKLEHRLKALPITSDQGEMREKIDQWYQEKTITAEEQQALYVIMRIIAEHDRALLDEITRLKEEGRNSLAQFIEKIREYFRNGEPENIVAEYEKRTKQQKEENIEALNQAIEATAALLALKETRYLYDKLVSLKPSAEHYFRFAVFLSTFNIFDDAIKNYQKALEFYGTLAENQPEIYSPYVAITLHNLANLHLKNNHLDVAEFEYQEALSIYRALAENQPEIYKPYVAITLNNLALLHKKTNHLDAAEGEYQEALGVYRNLAKSHPEAYKPYVARTLHNLANLHLKTNHLDVAEGEYQEALGIYRVLADSHPEAYKPYVARTLHNLANLHKKNQSSGCGRG